MQSSSATRPSTLGGVAALALATLGPPGGWPRPAGQEVAQRVAEDFAAWWREARAGPASGQGDHDEPEAEYKCAGLCRCPPAAEGESFLAGLVVGALLWPALDVLRLVQAAWRRYVAEAEMLMAQPQRRRVRSPADL